MHRLVEASLFTAAIFISTSPATAQKQLRVDAGPLVGGEFGWTVIATGDLDVDGVPDYLSLDPQAWSLQPGFMNIQLRSGATGAVLDSLVGLESTNRLAPIADVTGDGIQDFLTCSPAQDAGEFSQGAVQLHSGVTMTRIHTTFGSSTGVSMGAAGVVAIGDADGDGRDDYLTSESERIGISNSRASVLSSADGFFIREHISPQAFYSFGSRLIALPDLDNDGQRDYAISQEGQTPKETGIFVYSTASGLLLRSFVQNPAFGSCTVIASPGDLNGDGTVDFLVMWNSGQGSGTEPSAIRLHSGVDDSILHTFSWGAAYPYGSLIVDGDFDGDGTPDFVIGQPSVNGATQSASRIIIISGATLSEIARYDEAALGVRLGQSIVFAGDLDGQPGDEILAGAPRVGPGGEVRLLGYDPGIGSSVCSPANQNSTGSAGLLRLTGSAIASDNQLSLLGSALPPNAFAFGLCSQASGFLANPGGSQGDLCVAGSIGRIKVSLSQISTFGAYGFDLNTQSLPTPTIPVPALAGQTWTFQLWYRDNNPNSTSNFTNAMEVLFL